MRAWTPDLGCHLQCCSEVQPGHGLWSCFQGQGQKCPCGPCSPRPHCPTVNMHPVPHGRLDHGLVQNLHMLRLQSGSPSSSSCLWEPPGLIREPPIAVSTCPVPTSAEVEVDGALCLEHQGCGHHLGRGFLCLVPPHQACSDLLPGVRLGTLSLSWRQQQWASVPDLYPRQALQKHTAIRWGRDLSPGPGFAGFRPIGL